MYKTEAANFDDKLVVFAISNLKIIHLLNRIEYNILYCTTDISVYIIHHMNYRVQMAKNFKIFIKQ